MDAYTSFARVYDLFMDDIPYEEWCRYLTGLLREQKIDHGLVLDLGCGTGTMTELLAREGYDMIGVDASVEMLEIAMEKKEASGLDILYLLQDMRSFELYGTVRAVVSVCDSINYLLSYEDLVETFRLVDNYLDPGGIFLFDLNTEYKYGELLGESTIAEDREEGSFIWDNHFDPESRINQYDLTLFIPALEEGQIQGSGQGGLYRRYQETHLQRAFSLEEVFKGLSEAGLQLVACYDAFTREKPAQGSDRVYIVARERKKASARSST